LTKKTEDTNIKTDQWNRIETPKISPFIYGQMSSMGTRQTFQQMVLRKLDVHMQMNLQLNPLHHIHHIHKLIQNGSMT
jgi:hypothetical protein